MCEVNILLQFLESMENYGFENVCNGQEIKYWLLKKFSL